MARCARGYIRSERATDAVAPVREAVELDHVDRPIERDLDLAMPDRPRREAEPDRQDPPTDDDWFRAVFTAARETSSLKPDLTCDPDEPRRQGG